MMNANEPKIEQLTDLGRARLEGRVEAIGAMAQAFDLAITKLKAEEGPVTVSPTFWQAVCMGTETILSTCLITAPVSLGIVVSREVHFSGGIHLSIGVCVPNFLESLKRCNHTFRYAEDAKGGKSC